MNTPFKYRAFISYSHSDEKWARWLHHNLETYRIPKHLVGTETESGPIPHRFAPVFRDREELASATNLGTTLVAALEQSAMPDRDLLAEGREVALGQRGNPDLQAPRARAPRLLPDRRRRAGRIGKSRARGARVLSGRIDIQGGRRRAAHFRAQRADCGRRAAGQGPQGKRAAQAAGRLAGHRLRRAQAAGSPPALPPHGGAGVGIRRGHGHRIGARDDGLDRAQRSRAPESASRERGRDGEEGHELHRRPVQGLRPERGTREHHHGAGDPRQGCGPHRKGARGPAGHRRRR